MLCIIYLKSSPVKQSSNIYVLSDWPKCVSDTLLRILEYNEYYLLAMHEQTQLCVVSLCCLAVYLTPFPILMSILSLLTLSTSKPFLSWGNWHASRSLWTVSTLILLIRLLIVGAQPHSHASTAPPRVASHPSPLVSSLVADDCPALSICLNL